MNSIVTALCSFIRLALNESSGPERDTTYFRIPYALGPTPGLNTNWKWNDSNFF